MEEFELEALRTHSRLNDEELGRALENLEELRQANAALRHERETFEDRLSEIETSLCWLLMLRMQRLRSAVFRPGTLRGKCWTLASRFVKTASAAGARVALRKVRERVARKARKYRRGRSTPGVGFLASVFRPNAPVDHFRELPWKFLGHDSREASGDPKYFKILLVSHSACRTGAPLCLLRLAEELTKLPDVECFIVLQQGGELEESFARVAPTLEVEWLVAQGINRHDVPQTIASAFHEFSSRGMAVCNTLAVSEFHSAFAEQQVEVLSWIHELPTFISMLGGRRSMEAIERASRKIIVPSQAVRAALNARFQIDLDRIRTIYNGQDARTKGLDRESLRLQVRRELGLPPDARIVLGCGTVDQRKGADLFVNVARRFLLNPAHSGESPGTWFIWIGHCADENFRRWLIHDTRIDGLAERIRLVGPRKTMAPYYMAADLFALTSREDPCPLVNLEAMESGTAVVAFDDAGGAPEVLTDAGVCVPYNDQEAMAEAIGDLLANDDRRHEMGRRGQARIRRKFTWPRFMEEFLDVLQTHYNCRPSQRLTVSVIVPNYRYGRYLEERLQSIIDQSLRPHEIIFLDNASPDDSVEVARRMGRHSPVPFEILVNEKNNGSTFLQWLKGLSLATGDLVWIAESDDSAHALFLERLVPEFFDPDVALAYCQSALIGSQGERLSDDFHAHTDDISTSHWRGRFSADSAVEVEFALSQKNTIPNASAVVFRRPVDLDFADELAKLKFAGDWLFYVMLIRGAKVNYLPEVLNFYRRHEATVTHRSIRDDSQAYESLYVKVRVLETYPVSLTAVAGSLARSVFEYDDLTERLDLKRPSLVENQLLAEPLARLRTVVESRLAAPSSLRVLLVLADMQARDETYKAIELANALACEHNVFLANAQPHLVDGSAKDRLSPHIIFLEGTIGPTPWSVEDERIADQKLSRSLRRPMVLGELIRLLHIDVVHSHSLAADRLALAARSEPPCPWVIHASSVLSLFTAPAQDADSRQLSSLIVSEARGFFYEDVSELEVLEQHAPSGLQMKPRWMLDPGRSAQEIAACCAEAYREVRDLLAFPRPTDSDLSGNVAFPTEARKRA
jgi:glycosyltransferase involved in cell wall biosynthesis